MITVSEAISIIEKSLDPFPEVLLPVEEVYGEVLREDIDPARPDPAHELRQLLKRGRILLAVDALIDEFLEQLERPSELRRDMLGRGQLDPGDLRA